MEPGPTKPWKARRFLISLIVSLLLTPLIILGALSGGHHRPPDDSYTVFPYAMLLYRVSGHLPERFSRTGFVGALILLFGQIPFYGALIGYSLVKPKAWRIVIGLSIAHGAAALTALILYS